METFAYTELTLDKTDFFHQVEVLAKMVSNYTGWSIDESKKYISLTSPHITVHFSSEHKNIEIMERIGLKDLLNEFFDPQYYYLEVTGYEGFSKRNIAVFTVAIRSHLQSVSESNFSWDEYRQMLSGIDVSSADLPQICREILMQVPPEFLVNAYYLLMYTVVKKLGATPGEPFVPHVTVINIMGIFHQLHGKDADMYEYPEFYQGFYNQAYYTIAKLIPLGTRWKITGVNEEFW